MSIKAVVTFSPENYSDAEEVQWAVQEWQDTGDLSHITELIRDLEEIEVVVV